MTDFHPNALHRNAADVLARVLRLGSVVTRHGLLIAVVTSVVVLLSLAAWSRAADRWSASMVLTPAELAAVEPAGNGSLQMFAAAFFDPTLFSVWAAQNRPGFDFEALIHAHAGASEESSVIQMLVLQPAHRNRPPSLKVVTVSPSEIRHLYSYAQFAAESARAHRLIRAKADRAALIARFGHSATASDAYIGKLARHDELISRLEGGARYFHIARPTEPEPMGLPLWLYLFMGLFTGLTFAVVLAFLSDVSKVFRASSRKSERGGSPMPEGAELVQ